MHPRGSIVVSAHAPRGTRRRPGRRTSEERDVSGGVKTDRCWRVPFLVAGAKYPHCFCCFIHEKVFCLCIASFFVFSSLQSPSDHAMHCYGNGKYCSTTNLLAQRGFNAFAIEMNKMAVGRNSDEVLHKYFMRGSTINKRWP